LRVEGELAAAVLSAADIDDAGEPGAVREPAEEQLAAGEFVVCEDVRAEPGSLCAGPEQLEHDEEGGLSASCVLLAFLTSFSGCLSLP